MKNFPFLFIVMVFLLAFKLFGVSNTSQIILQDSNIISEIFFYRKKCKLSEKVSMCLFWSLHGLADHLLQCLSDFWVTLLINFTLFHWVSGFRFRDRHYIYHSLFPLVAFTWFFVLSTSMYVYICFPYYSTPWNLKLMFVWHNLLYHGFYIFTKYFLKVVL